MRPQRHTLAFVTFACLLTTNAALAQSNDYRIVTRRVVATPSDPTPLGITGDFGNVAIAPDGRVAFNATHRIQLPDGSRVTRRAAFVERDGQLQVVTAGLASDSQNSASVFAVDSLGNVVLRGRSGPAPGVDTFAIDRPAQAPFTLAAVGQPLPNLPTFTTSSFIELSGNLLLVPRNLPNDLQYAVPAIATPTGGGSPVNVMIAGALTGSRVVAASSLLTVANPPPSMFVAWPFSITSSGSFVTADVASVSDFPYLYSSPTATRLSWNTSSVTSQTGNMRIADNGTILASVDAGVGSAILMGTPGAMSVVLRDGSVISSSRGTAVIRIGPLDSFAFLSMDPDGTAHVFCTRITLSNPGQAGSFFFGVVRLRMNEPARLAYLATEPVRRRDGTLAPINDNTNVPTPLRVQSNGRLVWFVRLANSELALCSLTDDGDPTILFESSTLLDSPSILVPAGIVPPTQPAGSVALFSSNINNDAVLAINGATPAIVVSPSMRFTCGDPDFNNDGVYPTDQDMIDFFNVYAGNPCPTLRCDTLDFNRNGTSPEDQDVIDFLTVLAGGSCSS